MRALRARAPGKVNLCLHLGPPRDDGLHELVSVLQAISLADEVSLEAAAGAAADEVHCPGVEGPNLATRALADFRAATGWDAPPLRVTIEKRVPVAAGMGGGSADAAAVLRLARAASGLGDERLLSELAPGLGADVPAALEPGLALVTGAGEEVRPLPPAGPQGLLVVPLGEPLLTAEVFAAADRLGLPHDAAGLEERGRAVEAALAAGGLPPAAHVNDLEPAARSLCPAIEPALANVAAAGAAAALVSGSGPTVVGVFPGPEGADAARTAAVALRERHPAACAAEPVDAAFGEPQPAEALA
jgi:4-diphosphocytidyl-2-C-methyl-D-erythritol kinase